MNDQYPSTLNVEIDRDRLRNYLRVKWLLAWTLPLSFFGAMFNFAGIGNALDHGIVSRGDTVLIVLRCVGTGIGISLLIALLLYLLFSHRIAGRLAPSLEVSVEGAFVHVRQHSCI